MNWTQHCWDVVKLRLLFFSLHNLRAVWKIVGNKSYDVTVCELKTSPQLDKQTRKNKWIKLSEQRANSSAVFQAKLGVYLNPKLSPQAEQLIDAETQQCLKQQCRHKAESQFYFFIKLRGHFGNVFMEQSAVFVLLTFLLFFTTQKKNLA